MHIKQLSKRVVICGTLLIWMIKFVIRPFVHIPHGLKAIVGVTPNLIGSFLLPFGACWMFQRFFRLQTTSDLRFTCSIGLLLVIINEYLQLIPVFGRTFDYLDILFSFVGVLIGYQVFAKIQASASRYSGSVA